MATTTKKLTARQKAAAIKSGKWKQQLKIHEQMKEAQKAVRDPWTQAGEELATDPRIKDTRKPESKEKPQPKNRSDAERPKIPKKKKAKPKKPVSKQKKFFDKITESVVSKRHSKIFKVDGKIGNEDQFKAAAKRWAKQNDGSLAGFTEKHGYLRTKDNQIKKASRNNKTGAISVGLTSASHAASTKSYQERKAADAVQKSPNLKEGKMEVGTGFEAHHKRMLKLFTPFYEGLDAKDARKLTEWFVDEGVGLGTVEENLIRFTKEDHTKGADAIHPWMRRHGIQVYPAKPGETNFVYNKDGTVKRVKGGATPQEDLKIYKSGKNKGLVKPGGVPEGGFIGPKSKMPNMAHLDLNERMGAASVYLNYVQPAVDEKLKTYDSPDKETAFAVDPRRDAKVEYSRMMDPNRTKFGDFDAKSIARTGASIAGQSANPFVNMGGDVVGTVMDGIAFAGNPSAQNAIDLALSGGQVVTNLAALGFAALPIPGARPGAYAIMKFGDNLGKLERLVNMNREAIDIGLKGKTSQYSVEDTNRRIVGNKGMDDKFINREVNQKMLDEVYLPTTQKQFRFYKGW